MLILPFDGRWKVVVYTCVADKLSDVETTQHERVRARRKRTFQLHQRQREPEHRSRAYQRLRAMYAIVFIVVITLYPLYGSDVLRSACMYVCLSVCPLGYLKNASKFHQNFFVHVTRGRGSDLLWRQCNRPTLCTSGFVDDIMFSHNGANGPESKTYVSAGSRSGSTGETSAVSDYISLVIILCRNGKQTTVFDYIIYPSHQFKWPIWRTAVPP